MQMRKDRSIKCSAKMMAQLLEIMDDFVGSGKYNHLFTGGVFPASDLFLFRSGAKLGRRSLNEWYIYGYAAGGSDGFAAVYQLQAANHVRQAISLMGSVNSMLGTAPVKYHGLWGQYTNGTRTPNYLNYGTEDESSNNDNL